MNNDNQKEYLNQLSTEDKKSEYEQLSIFSDNQNK